MPLWLLPLGAVGLFLWLSSRGQGGEMGGGSAVWPSEAAAHFGTLAKAKAGAVASALGIPLRWLVAIIGFETGGSFNPEQYNTACSSRCGGDIACKRRRCAIGLIQFFPGRHAGQAVVGKTAEQLEVMSASEQLDLVKLYFDKNIASFGLRPSSLEDWYMVVHGPAHVGRPSSYTEADRGAVAGVLRYAKRKGLE